VLVAYLGGRLGMLSAHGAVLYVVARAVYIFSMPSACRYVRSLVWLASLVGILMILAALVI
jgi:uncharacterized MAPEG superfamily protein